MHPSNKVTLENLSEVVRYHAPVGDQQARHENIAAATEHFIRFILAYAPDCADRSSAIRHARLAKMEASAAIALEDVGKAVAVDQPSAIVDDPEKTVIVAPPGIGPAFGVRTNG